ncbi:hypothetical protein KKD61_04880 [Patescibacteria group bacterium]|nr:hypothetical protein [Patescibacteria group bacterium]
MAEIYHRGSKTVPRPEMRTSSSGTKPKVGKFRSEVYKMIGKKNAFFHAFVARPKKFNFETQLEGEKIILLLRPHPITQTRWILLAVIMSFGPLLLNTFPLFDFLPFRFKFIVILMWYLLVFAFALEKFLSWCFNVYVVTDERVIDIDFYNLIYKEISDAEIENIEDVTLVMAGVAQTVFNYGSVFIQTAAETPQLQFENVPNPALVVQVLKKMQMEERQETLEGRVR